MNTSGQISALIAFRATVTAKPSTDFKCKTMLYAMNGIPYTHFDTEDGPFALRDGTLLTRGNLWSDVRELAQRLPDRRFCINLCEDRYLFCLTLLAAMARRQVCLLPHSRLEGIINEILCDYSDAYIASDRARSNSDCDWFEVSKPDNLDSSEPMVFDDAQTALIAFTSGSTGHPQACIHRFGTFRTSARMALSSLEFGQRRLLIVSTTPPQHMYGLETSIFWPLFSNLVMYAGRPFFPEDIRCAIDSAPLPSLLASTPIHLRSLSGAVGNWSNLVGILSSTAQISISLARKVEATLDARLHEIYGTTETLSFASRTTTRETLWRPYLGAVLLQDSDGRTLLKSPHLNNALALQDLIRIEANGFFEVLGRASDMVKIGGKRTSLAELNRRLVEIEGIVDGLFFVREDGHGEYRMGAVVVSHLNKEIIRQKLKLHMDEVFLPRTIYFVASIPRNSTGKVVNKEWEALLRKLAIEIAF